MSSKSPALASQTASHLQIESFVCGPLQTNCYLLLDAAAHEMVVIDPSILSDEALHFAQKWRAQGHVLKEIWNTHGHFDHVYDNARWKNEFGAPILCHAADHFFLDHLREQSLWFGLPAPEIAQPDQSLTAGQTLRVGTHSATILTLPGHSPGSVGFYFEAQNFCVAGDVLFQGSVGRTDLPGCSALELANSVRRLFALPPQTEILPGHGPKTTVGEEKHSNGVARQLLDASE